jgi:hypothetical protein
MIPFRGRPSSRVLWRQMFEAFIPVLRESVPLALGAFNPARGYHCDLCRQVLGRYVLLDGDAVAFNLHDATGRVERTERVCDGPYRLCPGCLKGIWDDPAGLLRRLVAQFAYVAKLPAAYVAKLPLLQAHEAGVN